MNSLLLKHKNILASYGEKKNEIIKKTSYAVKQQSCGSGKLVGSLTRCVEINKNKTFFIRHLRHDNGQRKRARRRCRCFVGES